MEQKKYYEAYDDRYRQIHSQDLRWFDKNPSQIVADTIQAFSIQPSHSLLEIGCGEGRDAFPLLQQGFDLLATDVSPEAIRYCRQQMPAHEDKFRILDCVTQKLDTRFHFIYAVAVIHMLVPDADRDAFYRFIRDHLIPSGIALICTMGDGKTERQSDIRTAFALQDRIHEPTGTPVQIAGTSCRMVSFPTFERELIQNGLSIIETGITAMEPDFNQMMYAVVKRSDE